MKLNKFLILPPVFAVFASLMYLFTAAPFLLWLDAPRFVAAIVTLGVANPPEPLYILLAHPFIYLPFGSVIFKIQIFSALCAGLTLWVVYKLTNKLIQESTPAETFKTKEGKLRLFLSSLYGMLTLAFSYQFWSQAQNVETFMLVSLITAAAIYLVFKSVNRKSLFINLSVIALILGLATGTNPAVVSVIPAILWMMWSKRKYLSIQGFIIWFLIGIVAVILIHLYIPIRAQAKPFLNYWNAVDLEGVWNVSTGAGLNVYVPEIGRVNGFTGSPEVFFRSSWNFIYQWVIKFALIPLPFMILGAVYLWKRGRYYFYLLIPIIVTNFIFSGLYFSGNQESWFLVADIVWVILAGVGFYWVSDELLEKYFEKLKAPYLILLVLIPLIIWLPNLYRRHWVLTEDYIENLYRPMEGSPREAGQKAILFGSSDLYDSISFYVYGVKDTPHYKPNIIPITDNLLYILKWYRDHFKNVTDLKIPDDAGLKFDSAEEYSMYINEFFAQNIDKYRIYISIPAMRNNFLYGGADLGPSLKVDEKKFKLIPSGMLYEVVPQDREQDINPEHFSYKFNKTDFPNKKPFMLEKTYKSELTGVLNEYAYSLEGVGDYYLKQGKAQEAFDFYQKAYNFNPKNAEIISRLGNFYGSVGDHAKAAEYFEKALKIEPNNIGLLFNSAIAYENTGRIDKARLNLNKVLKIAKGDSQIGQLARTRLEALKQATPSGQIATASGDLQSRLLPKAQPAEGVYQNQVMNLTFSYPKGYKVLQDPTGVVTLTNSLKGKDELTLNFYSRKMAEGEAVDKLAENLPFKIDGAQLLSQPISLAGFSGVGRTIGSGEYLTFLLLLRRNDQGLVIKVYPGDTSKTEEFNQILSGISTIR